MSRHARAVDANHRAIVQALRACGAWVCDLHGLGNGVPDLLVSLRGRTVFLEVKDGTKVASKRRLTELEERFRATCPLRYLVVLSPTEAVEAITFIAALGAPRTSEGK